MNGFKIEMQANPDILASPVFHLFEHYLQLWRQTLGIKELVLTMQSPGVFAYHFEAVDGRLWKQTFDLTQDPDHARMTFDVADFFTFDELATHQDVRRELLTMVREHGMTACTCEW